MRCGRRPLTRYLTDLYDEGRIAFDAGLLLTDNPYAVSGKHGDDIRADFWRDGWQDGMSETQEIEALI